MTEAQFKRLEEAITEGIKFMTRQLCTTMEQTIDDGFEKLAKAMPGTYGIESEIEAGFEKLTEVLKAAALAMADQQIDTKREV